MLFLSLHTAAQSQTVSGNKQFVVLRGELWPFRRLPTQPRVKTSITSFIIEIDFSPACITKIYPSYFELGMCCSTKITISIQHQGQSKVLMLRNINCFIVISARIKNGSAVCKKLPPTISALSCMLFGRRLKSHSGNLPVHWPFLGLSFFGI